MTRLLKYCMFCPSELPKENLGVGEHIIPRSIMGFWRSHDVCPDCMRAFGKHVDHLSINHVYLLEAMKLLGIGDPEALLSQVPWQGIDTADDRKVNLVRRDGDYRVKVTRYQDNLEFSDTDLDNVAKPWLWERCRGNMSQEQFEQVYTEFRSDYLSYKPGEVYHSKVFGLSFRKRQVTNIQPSQPIPDDFTRIIAKIVCAFLYYAVPVESLLTIEELDQLRFHALSGEPLQPFTINHLRLAEDIVVRPFHAISIYPENRVTMVDTQLFARYCWRTVIHTPGRLIVTNRGSNLEVIKLVLDFANPTERKKYVGMKPFDSKEFEWSEFDV